MTNSKEKLKAGCRPDKGCGVECGTDSGDDLFSRDWEVFVIKRDEKNGNFVGKLACCAQEPV